MASIWSSIASRFDACRHARLGVCLKVDTHLLFTVARGLSRLIRCRTIKTRLMNISVAKLLVGCPYHWDFYIVAVTSEWAWSGWPHIGWRRVGQSSRTAAAHHSNYSSCFLSRWLLSSHSKCRTISLAFLDCFLLLHLLSRVVRPFGQQSQRSCGCHDPSWLNYLWSWRSVTALSSTSSVPIVRATITQTGDCIFSSWQTKAPLTRKSGSQCEVTPNREMGIHVIIRILSLLRSSRLSYSFSTVMNPVN